MGNSGQIRFAKKYLMFAWGVKCLVLDMLEFKLRPYPDLLNCLGDRVVDNLS